jgi:hypothetical protein
MRNFPRILFFIASTMPSDAESDQAMELGPNVAYRNASLVSTEGALEACDGVAGQVPQRYVYARPSADEAIHKWKEAEMERRQRRAAGLPNAPAPEDAETAKPKAAKAAPQGEQPKAAKAPVAWQPNGPSA